MQESNNKTESMTPVVPESTGSSVRRARQVLKWMALLFMMGIQVQVFIAGLALFSASTYWDGHVTLARYIAILPVFMIIVSFLAKLSLSLRMQIVALIGMITLMFLTAYVSTRVGFFAALHPVIAVALFYRTSTLFNGVNKLLKGDRR
ncbi:DUF6220 domain-containing protein [Virgibacillus oceani]